MQRKDNRGNKGRRGRWKSPSNASFKRSLRSRKLHVRLGGRDRWLSGIFRSNSRYARTIWGKSCASSMRSLKELSCAFGLSVAAGDLQLLDGKWYVTHAGLLSIANRSGCSAITTAIDHSASEPAISRWVFKATVYKALRSKGFVGYGDADPSNTSSLVRGAELRAAETRAVNRALRKAYGIGLCSVEELGSQPSSIPPLREGKAVCPTNGNGSANGQPRLRDKLCLLIRKYELDPGLVKRYAADFCGTESLRDAGRDLVEAFVSTVTEEAARDRTALICKLNSYSQPEEVRS
jgi:hypothetical protein